MTSNYKQEAVNDSEDSSGEYTSESTNAHEVHKATLQIDLENEEKAQIICKTLAVDKEPSRSTAKRKYSVQGHHLVVEIASLDAKYLQKSIDNLFNMCYLAKQTLEEAARYQLEMSSSVTNVTVEKSVKTKTNDS